MQQPSSQLAEAEHFFQFSKLCLLFALMIGLATQPARSTVPDASPSKVRVTTEPMKDVPFAKLRVTYQPESPDYPEIAKAQRLEGTVDVVVLIGKDGVPKSVEAIAGPLVLRPTAINYARHFRFEPVTTAGTTTVKDKNGKTTKKTYYTRIDARTSFAVPFKLKKEK